MHAHLLATTLLIGLSGAAQPWAQNQELGSPTPAPAIKAGPATLPAPSVPDANASGAPTTGATPGTRGGLKLAGVSSILVYDHNTQHGLAVTAAQNLSFFGTTVANSANFDSLLASGTWDAVAVDCPSTIPAGGWTALINYVNAGGRVVTSYWDWDAQAALCTAFDVSVSSSIMFGTSQLQDALTSPVFLNVTMPVSDWHGHWGDDGDRFNLLGGTVKLATLAGSTDAVMARGNSGRTIAAPALDEAGDTWLGDGSGVRLWENMILMVANASQGQRILVYDQSSNHLAQAGAFDLSPGRTHVATSTTFNSMLTGSTWDVVAVDQPASCEPSGGWNTLINYVNGGGHVAMSYWDWDASTCTSGALPAAFGVTVHSSFSDIGTKTLFNSGTTSVFAGVSMPNSDWNDIWVDDGDRFLPQGLALGLAHIGSASQPVMVQGNAGRTIAAFVIDNAGAGWLDDAITLWSNMLLRVSLPVAKATPRFGILGLNPAGLSTIDTPVLGQVFTANVSTTPTVGVSTLSTFVTFGIGGSVQGIPIFGYELLILPPYLQTTALGTHNIPIPADPGAVGVPLFVQGARVELTGGGAAKPVLLNALDLLLGF
jgi:hypothetical protein